MRFAALIAFACVAAAAWYLHDPPWVAGITSGLREWRTNPDGTRFRWTNGHGTFYIPSSASQLTLPLRAGFPGATGGPLKVAVSVDDRWLADVELRNPDAWVSPVFPMSGKTTRAYRRIDVRVTRVVGFEMLGVQLGEAAFRFQ